MGTCHIFFSLYIGGPPRTFHPFTPFTNPLRCVRYDHFLRAKALGKVKGMPFTAALVAAQTSRMGEDWTKNRFRVRARGGTATGTGCSRTRWRTGPICRSGLCAYDRSTACPLRRVPHRPLRKMDLRRCLLHPSCMRYRRW